MVGEVIIDPTAHHEPSPEENGILASHASGLMTHETPDHHAQSPVDTHGGAYESGRQMPTREGDIK